MPSANSSGVMSPPPPVTEASDAGGIAAIMGVSPVQQLVFQSLYERIQRVSQEPAARASAIGGGVRLNRRSCANVPRAQNPTPSSGPNSAGPTLKSRTRNAASR